MVNTQPIIDGFTCIGSLDSTLTSTAYATELSEILMVRGFARSTVVYNYGISGILYVLVANENIDWKQFRKHGKYWHISTIKVTR